MKELFEHNKTKNRYRVLYEAIDCTNSRDGLPVVVYERVDVYDGFKIFVREKSEFLEKFTILGVESLVKNKTALP